LGFNYIAKSGVFLLDQHFFGHVDFTQVVAESHTLGDLNSDLTTKQVIYIDLIAV